MKQSVPPGLPLPLNKTLEYVRELLQQAIEADPAFHDPATQQLVAIDCEGVPERLDLILSGLSDRLRAQLERLLARQQRAPERGSAAP